MIEGIPMIAEIIFRDVSPEDLAKLGSLFASKGIPQIEVVVSKPKSKIPAPGNSAKRQQKPSGFWKIPFKCDTSEYRRWVRVCQRYNLPYPEAKERYDKDHPVKGSAPAKSIPQVSDPASTTEIKKELSETTGSAPAPGIESILIQPVIIPDKTPDLTIGMKVKQIKKDRGILQIFGTGELVDIRAGYCRVKDMGGNFYKLPVECLAPAEA
jgi:hypothetical protein